MHPVAGSEDADSTSARLGSAFSSTRAKWYALYVLPVTRPRPHRLTGATDLEEKTAASLVKQAGPAVL